MPAESNEQNHSAIFNVITTVLNGGDENDILALKDMHFSDALSDDECDNLRGRFADIGRPELFFSVIQKNRRSIREYEGTVPEIDKLNKNTSDLVVEKAPEGFKDLPGEYEDIFFRRKEDNENISEELDKIRIYLAELYKEQFGCSAEIVFEEKYSGFIPKVKIEKLPSGIEDVSQLRPYLISRRSGNHSYNYEIYVDHTDLKKPPHIHGDVYADELWHLAHQKKRVTFIQPWDDTIRKKVVNQTWNEIPLRPHPTEDGGPHMYEVEVMTWYDDVHENTLRSAVELNSNPFEKNAPLEKALKNLCIQSAKNVLKKINEK